jgi:hypothetical protein
MLLLKTIEQTGLHKIIQDFKIHIKNQSDRAGSFLTLFIHCFCCSVVNILVYLAWNGRNGNDEREIMFHLALVAYS